MAQSLVLFGVARQQIVISGTAIGAVRQSLVISGVARIPQSITITGTTTAHQQLVINGTAVNPQRLTILGNARTQLIISGEASNPIILTPGMITFAHPSSPVKTIAVTQGSLSGPYTATSSDTSIATVVVSGSTVFVSSVAPGASKITVMDAFGGTASANAFVGDPAGALVLSTGAISLTTSSAPTTFTASRSGDTGTFTVSSTPPGIVSISGSGNAPGPVTYTVTPTMAGTATVKVSASDGTVSSLIVAVTGSIVAAVTSPRSETNLVIAVSEPGYTGPLSATFVGTTSATISPGAGFGPTQSFTITDATPGEFFLVQFTDANANTATLSLQTKNVSLGPVVYTFFDETGINPVAPGSQYSIYYQGDPQIPSTLSASGFIGVGGNATITLDQSTTYVIAWIGQQAPIVQTAIATMGAGTMSQSVTVTGYRSPNLSTLGYASQQLSQWTRGWVGDQHKQPGPPGTTGVAYSLAYSFASILGNGGSTVYKGQTLNIPGLDTFLQSISVSTRLLNCQGSQIDSWFVDFLGQSIKRQTGESDASFIARGLVAINGQVATRNALNLVTNAAWQTLGNAGTIICDDAASNPGLATTLSFTAPHFVVLLPTVSAISDAFLLDERYLGINTYLLALGTAITLTLSQVPLLVQQAVEEKRALGTIPIYAQYIS